MAPIVIVRIGKVQLRIVVNKKGVRAHELIEEIKRSTKQDTLIRRKFETDECHLRLMLPGAPSRILPHDEVLDLQGTPVFLAKFSLSENDDVSIYCCLQKGAVRRGAERGPAL